MVDAVPLTIRNGSFCCHLFDIDEAFKILPLTNIRKLLHLMYAEPYKNEQEIETFQHYIAARETELTETLKHTNDSLLLAAADMEAKRRTVAALGSALEQGIKNARKRLNAALRRNKTEQIRLAHAAYNRARQPLTDFEWAEKEVNRVKALIKTNERKLKRVREIGNVSKYSD